MKRIVVLVGSLRKQSFNRQLAHELETLIGNRADLSYLEWADVPLFNQDSELPTPAAVRRVRDEIGKADALWICTPEYNSNIPGGEKNLLDWLSRPLDPKGSSRESALSGKPVVLSGVGGKAATAGARKKLKELVVFMGMELVGDEGFGFALPPEAWASDELQLSDEAREELSKLVDAFLSRL